MVLIKYFVPLCNYTIRAIYKIDIFMDMNEDELSNELTNLLTKLTKGHRIDMGKVIHSLSDIERDIFMKAMDQKNKKQINEFEKMIKEKD